MEYANNPNNSFKEINVKTSFLLTFPWVERATATVPTKSPEEARQGHQQAKEHLRRRAKKCLLEIYTTVTGILQKASQKGYTP